MGATTTTAAKTKQPTTSEQVAAHREVMWTALDAAVHDPGQTYLCPWCGRIYTHSSGGRIHVNETDGAEHEMTYTRRDGELIRLHETDGAGSKVCTHPDDTHWLFHLLICDYGGRVNYRDEYANPALWRLVSGEDRARVLDWLREHIKPAVRPGRGVESVYGLKHAQEHETGIYLTTGQMSGAMLESGFKPFDTRGINWRFSVCWAKNKRLLIEG